MSISTLAHVCIKASDLQKTADFYCGALGMQKLFTFTRRGEEIGYYLKAGNDTFIEAFLDGSAPPTTLGHTLSHFCLQTDSVKDLRQRLLDAGYSPGEIKMGADNSWQFWIKDPSGVEFEFHEYTQQSSQRTGSNVEVDW